MKERVIYDVNLHTDDRVGKVIESFKTLPDWQIVRPLDSLNYGEGYVLEWRSIPIYLYDDERSDEVYTRCKGRFKHGEWEGHFLDVVKEMAGNVVLKFEIDRYDKFPSELCEDAAMAIKCVLIQTGYEPQSVTIEMHGVLRVESE
jgi:hypothetical protein